MAQEILVKTNTFVITKLPNFQYRQYDISYTPSDIDRQKKIRLFFNLQNVVAPLDFNPRMVYDGNAIAYAPASLHLKSASWFVNLGSTTAATANGRGTYNIRVTPTASDLIDPNDVKDLIIGKINSTRALVATNLLQVIVRQASNMQTTSNIRAYFTGDEKKVVDGSGLELWRGFFQSVRPTIGRMVLNIDTTIAAVYQSGSFIDYALRFLNTANIHALKLDETDSGFKRLESMVKKLTITIKIGAKSRKKVIRGLQASAGEYRFEDSEGREITVAEHFLTAYSFKVMHPKIIGIRLTGKKSERKDIVPAEICTIDPGQLFRRKLPENVVSEMVRFSAVRPEVRLSGIVGGVKKHLNSEFMAEAGMAINPLPTMAKGLILPPPKLRFKANEVNPSDGKWNVMRQSFYFPATMCLWAVVNFAASSTTTSQATRVAKSLEETCRNLGMKVNEAIIMDGNPNNVYASLDEAKQKLVEKGIEKYKMSVEKILDVSLIVILLPTHGGVIRTKVKHWGDILQGIVTNCLREDKIRKVRTGDQYLNNVSLKLNAHLRGNNTQVMYPILTELKDSGKTYMVMGADVGHPGVGVQRPSVTSLVYTFSPSSQDYTAITGIQEPRVEVIKDLHDFVCTAVYATIQRDNKPVEGVFFFRDGLSEGEFAAVAATEIYQIKRAFTSVYTRLGNEKHRLPKLVYIVVGKRHHITLYPENRDSGDKSGNCYAGTVVSSEITHPAQNDFYLQSHSAIQGTSRSSHYTIILDEVYSMDILAIQNLAYALCHSYAKATRAVSIPAPVYYADSVCSRLNFHINQDSDLFDRDDSMTNGSSLETFDLDVWKNHFRKVHFRLTHKMYFL